MADRTLYFRSSRTAIKLLLSFFCCFFFYCTKEEGHHITILHTNDMHGHFTAEPAGWLNNKPMVGGFVALDYYINRERDKAPESLLLDAGDLMTGNPICDLEYHGAEGGALIEMMNRMKYDAMVIGNHEFDKPADNLRKLVGLANFQVLCANLVDTTGRSFLDNDYHIFDVGGLKVGVIGITYYKMKGMAKAEFLDGFDSTEPAKVVSELVNEIDPITDLIIVLSHLGYESDVKLAKQIKNVDLIIGGHSHTRLKTPEKVNGILIAQAGSYTEQLGEINLTVAADSIMEFTGQLITTFAEGITPDTSLKNFVDSCEAIIDKEYDVVIGHSTVDLTPEYRSESNLGDYLADQIRIKTGADVAFINSGGIRKGLSAGPITLKDIYEMLPFQNYVQKFKCSGKELLDIVRENAEAQANETHGILQLSGIKYTWKKTDDSVDVFDVVVGDQPLRPEGIYTVASLDYVIGNHDKYLKMVPKDIEGSMLVADLIVNAIKETGEIAPRVEGRINKQ